MKDALTIALVQMASNADWQANVDTVIQRLAALPRDCDLAVFPENVFCLGRGATVAACAKPMDVLCSELGAIARDSGVTVVFGGVPVSHRDGVRNASIVFSRTGELLARYDKMHLFQLDPSSPGGIDETRIYSHGEEPVCVELNGWRIGLTVCYDLRFPELFRAYSPCDLIVCTAAFTEATGKAHWEVLLRARAIENLCYVAGVGQGGTNPETQTPLYGHSLAVDPWGKVMACAADVEETVLVELDKARIASLRRRLPALEHRRPAW